MSSSTVVNFAGCLSEVRGVHPARTGCIHFSTNYSYNTSAQLSGSVRSQKKACALICRNSAIDRSRPASADATRPLLPRLERLVSVSRSTASAAQSTAHRSDNTNTGARLPL
eukprot:400199-Pyramimonas_sp.AAC.3